jgi:hypothetical protein
MMQQKCLCNAELFLANSGPIGELKWLKEKLVIGQGLTGELTAKRYNTLTGIQYGTVADRLDG